MAGSHKQMQQRACINALRSHQIILEETIRRILDLMKMLPEGEFRNRLLKEIINLDVTADAMMWAVEMIDSE